MWQIVKEHQWLHCFGAATTGATSHCTLNTRPCVLRSGTATSAAKSWAEIGANVWSKWEKLARGCSRKIIQNSEQGWLATGCYSQNISQYGVVIHPHVTSPGFFVIQGLWWIIATVLQYLNVLNTHLHMHQKWWTQNFGRFQIPEIWHLGKAVFPAPSTRQLRSSGPVQVKVPASSLSGHRLLCSWVWHLKISGIPIEFKKNPWLILIFSSNRIFWGIPRFRRWKWWESSGQTDGCCQMKSSSKCFLNRDAGHTTNSHAFVSQVSTGV